MPLSIAQEFSNQMSGSVTLTLTPTQAYAPGALITLECRTLGSSSPFITGITGAGVPGGQWALQRTDNNINLFITEIWSGYNVGGGSANIVITYASSITNKAIACCKEHAGAISSGSPVDGVNGANGSNGTAASSGNVTPAAGSNVVLVNAGTFQSTGATVTAGPSNWIDSAGGAPTTNAAASYKHIASASGGYAATYAVGYNRYAISIVAFKAAAGGTNVTVTPSGVILAPALGVGTPVRTDRRIVLF